MTRESTNADTSRRRADPDLEEPEAGAPGRAVPNATPSSARSERPKPSRFGTKAKLILLAVVIALVAPVIAYFVGSAAGRVPLTAQLATAQAESDQMRQEATAAQAQNRLLSARGDVYRAAAELEQRNFGAANDLLRRAAQSLDSLDAAAVHVDAGKLTAVRQQIAGTNIVVTADVEVQRRQILQLAAQLDSLAGV